MSEAPSGIPQPIEKEDVNERIQQFIAETRSRLKRAYEAKVPVQKITEADLDKLMDEHPDAVLMLSGESMHLYPILVREVSHFLKKDDGTIGQGYGAKTVSQETVDRETLEHEFDHVMEAGKNNLTVWGIGYKVGVEDNGTVVAIPFMFHDKSPDKEVNTRVSMAPRNNLSVTDRWGHTPLARFIERIQRIKK